jgi:hypothetical protein
MLLLDTNIHGGTYEIHEGDGQWTFTINIADRNAADKVLQFKDQINIFVNSAIDPKQKTWYYSSDGNVSYDADSQQLTIVADSKMDYNV